MRTLTPRYDAGTERQALAQILATWVRRRWLEGSLAIRFYARVSRLARATGMTRNQMQKALQKDAMAILITNEDE